MLLDMEDLHIGVPGVVELLRSLEGDRVWMTSGIVFRGYWWEDTWRTHRVCHFRPHSVHAVLFCRAKHDRPVFFLMV